MIRTASSAELGPPMLGGFEPHARRHYETGGALLVHSLSALCVGAIPARGPLTRARLTELYGAGYEVVTQTPERYPERAYIRVPDPEGLEWAEVEVCTVTVAAARPEGLSAVHPHTFEALRRDGRGRVTSAEDDLTAPVSPSLSDDITRIYGELEGEVSLGVSTDVSGSVSGDGHASRPPIPQGYASPQAAAAAAWSRITDTREERLERASEIVSRWREERVTLGSFNELTSSEARRLVAVAQQEEVAHA